MEYDLSVTPWFDWFIEWLIKFSPILKILQAPQNSPVESRWSIKLSLCGYCFSMHHQDSFFSWCLWSSRELHMTWDGMENYMCTLTCAFEGEERRPKVVRTTILRQHERSEKVKEQMGISNSRCWMNWWGLEARQIVKATMGWMLVYIWAALTNPWLLYNWSN